MRRHALAGLLFSLLGACRLELSIEQVGQGGFTREDQLVPPGRFVRGGRVDRLLLPDVPPPHWSPGEWARGQVDMRAYTVLRAIHARDGETLSALVHPVLGVRFSPVAARQTTDDLDFPARDVMALLAESSPKRTYPWGKDAEESDAIVLTAQDYLTRYVDDRNWASAPRKEYRELHPTDDRYALYPQGIAVHYEYPRDVEGTPQGLELVFMRTQSEWWLVAIAHD